MNSERRKLEAKSWLAVVQAYQSCNRRYARLLATFDLTVPQFDVLNAIHRLEDTTPKSIAGELVVTRGNITGVLRRLQQRGLITTRVNAEDARSFCCTLTRSGRELLERSKRAAASFISAQLAPFGDAELETTLDTMTRMRTHLRSLDPESLAREA